MTHRALILLACFTACSAYVYRTGGKTGKGVISQAQYDEAHYGERRYRNPATGMLGAYNYDGETYTSTRFMSIRQPYRAAGGDGLDTHGSSGIEWTKAIPGYRRNQHLWAGDHQKNYVPIRDRDGWVRRFWSDRDAWRAYLNRNQPKGMNINFDDIIRGRGSGMPARPQPRPTTRVRQPTRGRPTPVATRGRPTPVATRGRLTPVRRPTVQQPARQGVSTIPQPDPITRRGIQQTRRSLFNLPQGFGGGNWNQAGWRLAI